MSRIPWKSLREDGLNLPNSISHVRILAAPVAAFFLLVHFDNDAMRLLILSVLVVIAATDGVDGFIARKYQMTSEWGAFFDPIADKILVTLVLIALCIAYYGDRLWWIVVSVTAFCVVREIVLAIQIGRANQSIQPPTATGKQKTVFQMIMLAAWIAPVQSFDFGLAFMSIATNLAIIWTLVSWIDYHRLYVSKT